MLATTSILLRGIPFIYQGQEIGMTNCRRNAITEYDDINTKDQYQVALEAGCTVEEALQCCYDNSRDNGRTPMQWSSEKNAGFTTGNPWLSLNPNYVDINVEDQEKQEDSVLNYYRKLVALRKSDNYRQTFTYGKFIPAYEKENYAFAYTRKNEETGQQILVAGNYGKEPCVLELDNQVKAVLLSNMGKEKLVYKESIENQRITLESCESVVVEL